MQNYKDLKVWEKAHLFTFNVYEVTKAFPKEELYSLVNQLRRCASSVPANIAEGCGKNGNTEPAHYLNIAPGSVNESEYLLMLSRDIKYPEEKKSGELSLLINEVKGMLISLITKVRS